MTREIFRQIRRNVAITGGVAHIIWLHKLQTCNYYARYGVSGQLDGEETKRFPKKCGKRNKGNRNPIGRHDDLSVGFLLTGGSCGINSCYSAFIIPHSAFVHAVGPAGKKASSSASVK